MSLFILASWDPIEPAATVNQCHGMRRERHEYVYPIGSVTVAGEVLIERCQGRIASFKIPRKVIYLMHFRCLRRVRFVKLS